MSDSDGPNPVTEILERGPPPLAMTFVEKSERARRAWTAEEDAYLLGAFRKRGIREIASRLSRTRSAVYQRALKVLLLPRVKESTRGRAWESSEEEFLRENYGRSPTKEVATTLGRTASSIHDAASRLHLTRGIVRGPNRRWTEGDERMVLADYGHVPVKEIAVRLNRTALAVRQRTLHPRWVARPPTRTRRTWIAADDQLLRSGYRRVPTRLIARSLDRTVSSVNVRAHYLGLTRHVERSPPRTWTGEEDEFLTVSYGKIRLAGIARKLGRTRASIYHRAETLGLTAAAWSPEFLRRQSLPRTALPFHGFQNDLDVGYVAGIVDGEGSIVGPPKVTLQVSMTTREVTERLLKLCGGTVTGPYEKRSGKSEVCKPQYHWTVSSAENVYQILLVLLPHLIVKREKAEMVIHFLERKWSP